MKEIWSYATARMNLENRVLSGKKMITEEQMLHDFTYI